MSGPRNKKRGIRYRAEASLLTGVFAAMLLAWYGSKHHHHGTLAPASEIEGLVLLAIVWAVVMFVLWSIGSAFKRAGRRANDQASQPTRRTRRYGYER